MVVDPDIGTILAIVAVVDTLLRGEHIVVADTPAEDGLMTDRVAAGAMEADIAVAVVAVAEAITAS